jgi:putative transposase
VPRDREGEIVTELFERYKRMTGDVEETLLQMYLSGISVRQIAGVTDALGRLRIGKDAVSRISPRLQKEQRNWRERSLEEKVYPYLYLNATYLKVRSGASFHEKALFVKVDVAALDRGRAQRLRVLRHASIRTFSEPTPR